MQVVLNEDLKNLGYKGEVVRVRDGYFRNYLFPRGLAHVATKGSLKVVVSRKEKLVMKRQQILENVKEVLAKLKDLVVTFKGKVTKKGNLYGAITEDDLIEKIEQEAKLKLQKQWIKMEHLKAVGEHSVLVHLGEGLEEKVKVVIEAE